MSPVFLKERCAIMLLASRSFQDGDDKKPLPALESNGLFSFGKIATTLKEQAQNEINGKPLQWNGDVYHLANYQ